jgi:hypothetical protein
MQKLAQNTNLESQEWWLNHVNGTDALTAHTCRFNCIRTMQRTRELCL